MRRCGRMLLAGLLAFGVLAPLRAFTDAGPDEIEANRARVQQLRGDPAADAELMRKAGEFLRLPEERRQQVERLGQELRHLDPARRDRLHLILKRYAAWQRRLDPADLRHLRDAPDVPARLEVVRELRERDWIRRLPRAQRDRLAALPARQRAEEVRKLRQHRQLQKENWQLAFRFWDALWMRKGPLPAKLADLPADVQEFFRDYLEPRLSPAEKAALTRADGNWPDYPQTLVELADRHPPALPGPTGPKGVSELPEAVRADLRKGIRKVRQKIASDAQADKFIAKQLRFAEGKWPGFGSAVADLARRSGVRLPHELFASRFFDLSPGMKQFVDARLRPLLTPEEQKRLSRAVGSWPGYPQAIQELAGAHGLRVPWQSLPDLPEAWKQTWNQYRPDVPVSSSEIWRTPLKAAPLNTRAP